MSQPSALQQPAANAGEKEKIRILILEDDAITARIFTTHFLRAGLDVKVASDGATALTETDQFRPHGFLIDYMTPRINGIELIKQIRARIEYRSSPVFLYSNASVPHVIQAALAAGASQVFDKSWITPAKMAALFKSAVSRQVLPQDSTSSSQR